MNFLLSSFLLLIYLNSKYPTFAIEILSKSKLERCTKSDTDKLDCEKKVVVNVAVPSGSSGGEASIVAELVEMEDNSTQSMQRIRTPPVITINKSAAYALYQLIYIRDVSYKPQEYFVRTRKCEPDAGADVVKICERLTDKDGNVIEHTQPTCCPCGPQHRVPSSCGNFFESIFNGKANTAHCLRFPGDWFHVFGIGKRSLGFSVNIQVKQGTSVSEVVVGPENRTVLSNDNFLRVNLVGDFVGYNDVPSFDEFYLVTPRLVPEGQPHFFGKDYSKWMLLERVRFTLDGLECNKIGVSYEAYNGQPNFCETPIWSCLHNQLWNFWEVSILNFLDGYRNYFNPCLLCYITVRQADQNRISRKQPPQYVVEGRFERINQHPNAGPHSFSIGITEVLNTNLLIELRADDIQYVYQRSPGAIISINIPTFEALTQYGTATISTKNTGQLEASYSLTFGCQKGVNYMEEQYYIMKPGEVVVRSFYLYPTTEQAAKYKCTAILKASDFTEVDRAECQFTTTETILDNGTQIIGGDVMKKSGISGFFESIKSFFKMLLHGLVDFFTGKTCRNKCSSFFDITCHIQYICASWIILFALLLSTVPSVIVIIWLLHQKGCFDPIYDSCCGGGETKRIVEHGKGTKRPHTHRVLEDKDRHKKRRSQNCKTHMKRRRSSEGLVIHENVHHHHHHRRHSDDYTLPTSNGRHHKGNGNHHHQHHHHMPKENNRQRHRKDYSRDRGEKVDIEENYMSRMHEKQLFREDR